MSFVNVATDAASEAVEALRRIGPGLDAARATAAAPTSGIAAAAQDEVSTAIARLFGNLGQEFQGISAQAQAFHDRFATTLGASVGQYASAEATNAQLLLLNPAASPLDPLLPGSPVSIPVIDYPTPLGPINLTLYGESTVLPPGLVNITAGSLQVPTALALAYDAISPVANVVLAVQKGSTAFTSAVQTGNALGAATALVQTPVDAITGFFFGGQEITGSASVPAYTGYSAVDYSVPVGGLFSPVQPVTLTLYRPTGSVTVIPLSGTQFGGIFAGIGSALTGGLAGG